MPEQHPFDSLRHNIVAARIEFMAQLAKFSQDEREKRPTAGQWTPLEVAYHLYQVDAFALEQLQLVQAEDNPLIATLEEDTPPVIRPSEAPLTLNIVLAGMAARREEIFAYLSALPVETWERPCRHPRRGQITLYQLVSLLPEQDMQHLQRLVEN